MEVRLISKIFLALLLLTVTAVSWGATITVISPNGGERWYTNNEHQIRWNTRNLGGEVRIVLHAWSAGKPSGSADFYRWITWRTPNDGYYTWEIPADIPLGNKYKLYIRRGNAVQNHDDSNGYFTIGEKSTVTTFTGYCFRPKDEYFYQSSYLGKCVGSDRNISKQEFDNRHLPSNTTASPRHYLLQVTSNISRAEIWIDGEYRGLTPGFNIKVVRDWNTVVVKRSGYENYSTTVKAATGQHVFANLKKRISLSTTASSSRKYCYRASPVRFYTPTDRICKSGDREITRKEYDNRKIVSTIGGNDERKRVSTAARSYSNNILGYCYDPPAQLFYIKDAAECAGSDLEITKQEFKNKTVVSATFRFLDSHWYRAHCLGNVEFPCRFTYGIKTHGNRRIVIQTKQGEIIFPDGSTYIGPFDRGIWHGHGTYIFSDKRKYTYTGQFKNGRAHGRGVLVLSNGVRFDGLFRNGKKWWGTEFYKRGKIVASFSNGKRHPKLY